VVSGALLIGGTTIGAGMLGIPLITAQAGFLPAFLITAFVWLFMLLTGLLFLEATLWMHQDANILSMTHRFLGYQGKVLAGSTFVFLYYCLLVAYFAAGAPLFAEIINKIFEVNLHGWQMYGFFGLVFAVIVAMGISFIDRINYILMIGMFVSYFLLMGMGNELIDFSRLEVTHFSKTLFAAPVLFSAFGYHNIIPSLTFHFKGNGKVMRYAIIYGTLIPFVMYTFWQFLIIGALPQDIIVATMKKGAPITSALQSLSGHFSIALVGNLFALFALVTSTLGVAFSVVDFLGDGLGMRRTGKHRYVLCLLTFLPPFIFTTLKPAVFVLAIGVAGGFGEAFLNGILPAWLVWIGRYSHKLPSKNKVFGGKILLTAILIIGFLVMGMEALHLMHH